MSSVLRPVGGQPPGVYWRRRVAVLVVLVLLLLIVGRACDWFGGSTPTASPSPTPSITASSTPSTTPSTTPSPSATTTPSATTSPSTTSAAAVACKDSEVRVSVTVQNQQNPVGGPVRIRFVVATDSDVKCLRDVGAAKNEVLIKSDGQRVWSSDDCTPGGAPNVRPISKNSPFAVTVSWQGDVSTPGCPTARPKAPAGSYNVTGRNATVTSAPAPFTLG